jgi:hypothetical protein
MHTLHLESRLKKLGPTLSIFGLLFGTEVINKCENIDVRILINARTLAPQGLQIGFPKFGGIQGSQDQSFSIMGESSLLSDFFKTKKVKKNWFLGFSVVARFGKKKFRKERRRGLI